MICFQGYCSDILKVFGQWQTGDILRLSTFAQEMKEKTKDKEQLMTK